MSRPSTIRNLGPKTDIALEKAGIKTAEEVRELGAKETMRRLLAAGQANHVLFYQAIYMGLMDRAWNDATDEEKAQIKAEYAALRTEQTDKQTPSDNELAKFGVLPE